MKTLYIVRHAKSSWDNSDLDDFDRPLNERGKRNAPEMGERLKEKGIKPDLIISSSAKRAFSTAKKIAKEVDYPVDKIKKSENLYLASISSAINIIRQVDDSVAALMIFGHNPGWTELSNYLCDVYIDNIPTAGVSAIRFDFDSWAKIDKGKGKMLFFDYPKKF